MRTQALVFPDISGVECEQEVLDPDVRGVVERGEDRVLELKVETKANKKGKEGRVSIRLSSIFVLFPISQRRGV